MKRSLDTSYQVPLGTQFTFTKLDEDDPGLASHTIQVRIRRPMMSLLPVDVAGAGGQVAASEPALTGSPSGWGEVNPSVSAGAIEKLSVELLKVDMDNPQWALDLVSSLDQLPDLQVEWTNDFATWPSDIAAIFTRLANVYARRLDQRRSDMRSTHDTYRRFIEACPAPMTAESGLQALPVDILDCIFRAALSGESPRRRLQFLKLLERVSKFWALRVAREIAQSPQPELAKHEAGILACRRAGVTDPEARKAGEISDLTQLSLRWNLPALKPAGWQAIQSFGFVPGSSVDQLDIGKMEFLMPDEAPKFEVWKAFVQSCGAQLRRLRVPLNMLGSDLMKETFEYCPDLNALILEDRLSDGDYRNAAIVTEMQCQGLGALQKITSLTTPCLILEKLPDSILAGLKHLTLNTRACSAGEGAQKLAQLTGLEKLLVTGSLYPLWQDPWLRALPAGLQCLECEYIDKPQDLVLPADLHSFSWTGYSKFADLKLPKNLRELTLREKFSLAMVNESVDTQAICDWLTRYGGSLQKLNWSQIGLIPAMNVLSHLPLLRDLELNLRFVPGDSTFDFSSIAKLKAFIARNGLCRLRLLFYPTEQDLSLLPQLLEAIGASASLRSFELEASSDNEELEQAIGMRMLGPELKAHRGLDWSFTSEDLGELARSQPHYLRT